MRKLSNVWLHNTFYTHATGSLKATLPDDGKTISEFEMYEGDGKIVLKGCFKGKRFEVGMPITNAKAWSYSEVEKPAMVAPGVEPEVKAVKEKAGSA